MITAFMRILKGDFTFYRTILTKPFSNPKVLADPGEVRVGLDLAADPM